MCNSWKFNDYCSVPNSSNGSNNVTPKNLQRLKSKSNKYDGDVPLFVSLQMNYTDQVNI